MSTYEEVTVCERDDVPKGYIVKYHELRGYDSPDRWYTAATVRGRNLGEHATYESARDVCIADATMRHITTRTPKKPDRRQGDKRQDTRRRDDKRRAALGRG